MNSAGCGRCEFVHAIVTRNNKGTWSSTLLQYPDHNRSNAEIAHPNDLTLHTSGVRKRSKEVKNRGHAKLRANWSGMTHCRMKRSSETERNTCFRNTMGDTWTIEFEWDAKCFEEIKRTRGRGSFAISVFHYSSTCARCHETSHCRNIQGMSASTRCPASAHNVNGVWSRREFDWRR
ncbi:unannotated protein [freshwater metagenome]|uniref:Unannotated protein n=1 Tax=freshwater metagenome TaxID=449393 RepID=A0A6J7MNK3_9ZZZZ